MESVKMMKTYIHSLPTGARFTVEILLKIGAAAEAVGATPADVFSWLTEIAKTRRITS